MMRNCSVRASLQSFGAALMLAASLLVSPMSSTAPAHAAPAEAGPSRQSSRYLDQLLNEINGRRAMVGSPPLSYADDRANEAVFQYLADLTPLMMSMNACFHGMHNPVAPGWDYVAASGLDGEARGEVIGCPMNGYQWTPQQITASWWESPVHFEALYGDPEANVVACGGYGEGRRGFESVACVTFRV
jgi:hypothetical protein